MKRPRRPRGRPIRVLEAEASAKVNLAFRVGERRPDGFHDVVGLVQTITLRDRLIVRLRERTEEVTGDVVLDTGEAQVSLTVTGPEASEGLASEDNLVMKAAALLAAWTPPRPTEIELVKHIPVAAGLGGGSADAAAAIGTLALSWSADLRGERLVALASQIGSDVPAILSGGLVHVSGRGERIRRVGCATGTGFVLGLSHARLSTPDVYARFDELRPASRSGFTNDLEPAAISLEPSIAEGLAAMRAAGATTAMVAGSGPTVVGITSGLAEAQRVATRLDTRFREVVACEASGWGVRVGPLP